MSWRGGCHPDDHPDSLRAQFITRYRTLVPKVVKRLADDWELLVTFPLKGAKLLPAVHVGAQDVDGVKADSRHLKQVRRLHPLLTRPPSFGRRVLLTTSETHVFSTSRQLASKVSWLYRSFMERPLAERG